MTSPVDAERHRQTTAGPRLRVMGSTGSGKTTAGRAIAAALGVPFLELDNVFWHMVQPMYSTNRSDDECRAILHEFLETNPAWVMDGNYTRWSQAAMDQATDAVLFDLPLHRRLWRLWGRWWVGRRGLQGGDGAMLSSTVWLFHWAAWGSRHSHKRRMERLRASGVPWTLCRTNAQLRAFLARYPGATEGFDEDVRRGKREAEAVISGRRSG